MWSFSSIGTINLYINILLNQLADGDGHGLVLHPSESTGAFEGIADLLQLCSDPSKLGHKLLDTLSSFSTANLDINLKSKLFQPSILLFKLNCSFNT